MQNAILFDKRVRMLAQLLKADFAPNSIVSRRQICARMREASRPFWGHVDLQGANAADFNRRLRAAIAAELVDVASGWSAELHFNGLLQPRPFGSQVTTSVVATNFDAISPLCEESRAKHDASGKL